jgi:hypothetical protein
VSSEEWFVVLGLAALVLPAVELAKLFNRARLKKMGMSPPPSSAMPTRRGR